MERLPWIHIDDEIKHFFQQYYRLQGVRLSIFTPEGKRLFPGKDQPDCPYCLLVRHTLGKDARCVELDRNMIARSIREDRMIRYHCHGGLEEVALPLKVDGGTIGGIMLGQFRATSIETSPYREEWSQTVGDNQLEQAFSQTPQFGEEQIQLLMETYQFLLRLIARERLIRNRDYDVLMPLIDTMEKNPVWNPSVKEAATLCARSPSSLNRLIKKVSGKSFKTYIIENKLSRAETLFTRHPEKTIAEIAAELGYNDPLYFSRIYRRYRGVSPKVMRERSSKERSPLSASQDSRQLDPAAAAMASDREKS